MCQCCYVCIKLHSKDFACSSCTHFLNSYFPVRSALKLSKSVSSELKGALLDLFSVMSINELKVESNLSLGVLSFIGDFIKVVDEIKTDTDIVNNYSM